MNELNFKSLWYKYKTEVWLEGSEQSAVVHNIMRVLRSINYSGDIAYLSLPITSGKFLYDLRLKNPGISKSELIKEAISKNYQTGFLFLEELRKRIACPIIFPADLIPIHQRWEQKHFQALWLSIIAEKCTQIHMSEGWEYSNGGSEELVHAFQLKLGIPYHNQLVFFNTKESESTEITRMKSIKIYDHLGNTLTIDNSIKLLKNSIEWLSSNNFDVSSLANSLDLLIWTKNNM